MGSDFESTDWKNIYVISFFSFIDAFQFSFFVWSFWPFVQKLDPTITPAFVGLIMSVSGMGEAIFAPIFGFWTNRIGRVNPPLMASLLLSVVANWSYIALTAMPKEWTSLGLLISRFLSGAGSGNRGSMLAFTAAASRQSDRTRGMALCGGGALIGLTAGPAIQICFSWMSDQNFQLGPFQISMFTGPAVLAFLINIFSIFFLLFCLDDRLEERDSDDDSSSRDIVSDSDSSIPIRADIIAILICMSTRSARMLVTANIESIGAPFSQLMFHFDDSSALYYNSLAQLAIGILTTLMLIIYAFTNFTKWISERMNCLWALMALLLFHLITFPFPFLTDSVNCPKLNGEIIWSWCENLGAINIYLFYGSYVMTFGIVLPCLNNSLQSLYSLILGNDRQGTMQGLNQTVGSLSRILGPLMISWTFTHWGPQATWGIELCVLALFVGIWLVGFERLVPFSEHLISIRRRSFSFSDKNDLEK